MLISKSVLAAILTITGLLTSQIVPAAEAQITQKIGSAETPATAQKTQPSADNANIVTVNAITGAAAKAGVAKCLARVNQVTSFVTANSESAAYLFISHTQQDNRFFSASIEIQQTEILTYASAGFAPVGEDGGGCGGVYETVTYWPDSCEIVGSALGAAWR